MRTVLLLLVLLLVLQLVLLLVLTLSLLALTSGPLPTCPLSPSWLPSPPRPQVR